MRVVLDSMCTCLCLVCLCGGGTTIRTTTGLLKSGRIIIELHG